MGRREGEVAKAGALVEDMAGHWSYMTKDPSPERRVRWIAIEQRHRMFQGRAPHPVHLEGTQQTEQNLLLPVFPSTERTSLVRARAVHDCPLSKHRLFAV